MVELKCFPGPKVRFEREKLHILSTDMGNSSVSRERKWFGFSGITGMMGELEPREGGQRAGPRKGVHSESTRVLETPKGFMQDVGSDMGFMLKGAQSGRRDRKRK